MLPSNPALLLRPAPIKAAAGASLSLDFTTGSLPGGVTLTRSSAGFYYNSSGVLTSAANDTARFDYNASALTVRGLLIEPAGTNILLQSQNFETTWTKDHSSITTSATTSPDNTSDGEKLVEDGTTNVHDAKQEVLRASSGVTLQYSFYAKASTRTRILALIANSGETDGVLGLFDLSGKQIASSAAFGSGTLIGAFIEDVGNGWCRCGVGGTFGVDVGSWFYSRLDTGSGLGGLSQSYAGDGSSGAFIFGAQAEVISAFPGPINTSSYIPTTTGAASRSADVCAFTIPAGIGHLTYTFDDNSTQTASVSPGSFTVPTNLNRPWIKTIVGSA